MIDKPKQLAALTVFAVTVFAGTSACGGSSGDINSIDDLRAAFEKAGGNCSEWEPREPTAGATAAGDCNESTVLSIYSSHSKAKASAQARALIFEGDVLLGRNWIVNTDADKLPDLKEALGGEIYSGADLGAEVASEDAPDADSREDLPKNSDGSIDMSPRAFVAMVRDIVPAFSGVDNGNVVTLGTSACGLLGMDQDFDATATRLMELASESGTDLDAYGASAFLTGAVNTFCPELDHLKP